MSLTTTTSSAAAATAPSSTTAAAIASSGPKHAWEDTAQSWSVQEDADGNLILASNQISQAQAIRQRRQEQLHQGDYSQKRRQVVRDLIRYLYIIIDGSRWMQEKDIVLGRGTRMELVLAVLQNFVAEYFDQNPLSHLGLILLKDGQAEIISHLSSNIKTHKLALESLFKSGKPSGECSLQNGLELAGRSLGHLPKFASREVAIVMGALSTCDPGNNILVETLPKLVHAKIRVSTLCLAAELHVCRKVADETGGILGVCLNGTLLRDWFLLGQVVPPPAIKKLSETENSCDMVMIGFPTRHTDPTIPTLVHATRNSKVLCHTAYNCPTCQTKVMELPTDCAVCGLKLVLAPHLARSFHHLFPVPPFVEQHEQNDKENHPQGGGIVSSTAAVSSTTKSSTPTSMLFDSSLVVSSAGGDNVNINACFGCNRHVGPNDKAAKKETDEKNQEEVLKFKCPDCHNVYCADCDAYLHETLHNCPGCLL